VSFGKLRHAEVKGIAADERHYRVVEQGMTTAVLTAFRAQWDGRSDDRDDDLILQITNVRRRVAAALFPAANSVLPPRAPELLNRRATFPWRCTSAEALLLGSEACAGQSHCSDGVATAVKLTAPASGTVT
jgi:hypothetical protein